MDHNLKKYYCEVYFLFQFLSYLSGKSFFQLKNKKKSLSDKF